ncbi:MAG TPA: Sir2 family NAD-dependent protein deacetylase [Polyangiales bacterium]|nr:Sir2 family NAD-dependent protein deacetylase [Polyangiales bacterium]
MTHSEWLRSSWDGRGLVLVLTGAGISAESGVPTFRGEEGYWRIGSQNYFPEQLATRAAFEDMPDEIWGWYLYRRSVCRAAAPNPGHLALARLERELGERYLLVTQNVDGLHLRAGSTLARTYQIHGNIDYMRALHDRDGQIFPLPEALGVSWERGRAIGPRERQLLVSPLDGTPARPHVLWFDESYDEARFRFHSALSALEHAGLVIVVGTSGATNLPTMLVEGAYRRRIPLLVINRDPSPFSELAERSARGLFLQAAAGAVLPELVDALALAHPL